METYYKKCLYEAGCDEAGRGCLAGPVVAAAVVLDPDSPIEGLNDSKKLTFSQREKLRILILEKALGFGVSFISPEEIDKINILQASLKAMHQSLMKISVPIEHVIVDGNKKIPGLKITQTTLIKGDARYASIAAASILAKTFRDDYMKTIHEEFPQYGWDSNKGYPSLYHRKAIMNFGWCLHHRKTFRLKELEPTLF